MRYLSLNRVIFSSPGIVGWSGRDERDALALQQFDAFFDFANQMVEASSIAVEEGSDGALFGEGAECWLISKQGLPFLRSSS